MSEETFYNPEYNGIKGNKISFPDGTWVELINFWGSSYTVVQAARVSFINDDRSKGYEKDLDLLRRLMNDGHLGPFEHVGATFRIYTPIFIARQIFRTRTASYNETSRRFTSRDIDFWFPTEEQIRYITTDDEVLPRDKVLYKIDQSYKFSWKTYKELLDGGVVREIARTVLPMGLMTKFYMTANLRNWLHFLDLRKNTHAQYEAQEVAWGIEQILNLAFPDVMEAWRNAKTRGWW